MKKSSIFSKFGGYDHAMPENPSGVSDLNLIDKDDEDMKAEWNRNYYNWSILSLENMLL